MSSPAQADNRISVDGESVPPDFKSLNRHFYHESGPGEFLLMRFHTLCVVGGAYEEFKAILAEGVEFAGSALSIDGATDHLDSPEETADQFFQQHYLRIETHHLKHLAIETLVRLFLGHLDFPECPWFEMSRELAFSKFKKSVRSLIVKADAEALQSDVVRIILGQSSDLTTATKETLDSSSNLARFLRLFASDWLEEAKSYNATKHGLTARPDSTELLIAPSSGGLHQLGRGDSLTHLSTQGWKNDRREWSLTTRWISREQAVASIYIVIQMIRALWRVARVRYGLCEESQPLELPSPDFTPEKLRAMECSPTREMTMPVFTEFKHAPHFAMTVAMPRLR